MALTGNGQLLVKTASQPLTMALRGASSFSVPGYELEPLSPAPHFFSTLGVAPPRSQWLLARLDSPIVDTNPWDTAHAAAAANGYSHFVEPDLLHAGRVAPASEAVDGLNRDWPPYEAVSPGWHLGSTFTGFADVRDKATGKGIRIAHLDTGYTENHCSRPRNLNAGLAYDYWANKQGATDPGTNVIGIPRGHGTATLALLAGNTVDFTFGEPYRGDIGGAPDAEIIPVRISPSVIHLYTSTMALGLYHALVPKGEEAPDGDSTKPSDVVSISHGGLPCPSWAGAVNALYEAGITVVAASGDSIDFGVLDLATRYTVYPSAFNRVITAVGATFLKDPYITDKIGVMQGCWGPESVMKKAIAGYTPNVAWMRMDEPLGFDMDGGGTSSSTPQIAAACALWLQLYSSALPRDWSRVEACRLALFKGADPRPGLDGELGWGLLNVPKMLNAEVAAEIIADLKAGKFKPSPEDHVSVPFWRLLLGMGPPDSEEERMYEAEVAQIVTQSQNNELLRAARQPIESASVPHAQLGKYREMLEAERISGALRKRLARSNALA